MNVRDRLERMTEYGMLHLPPRADPHEAGERPDLRPFQPAKTPRGVTWVRRELFPADHIHGNMSLGSLRSHPTGALSLLTGGERPPDDWTDLLFLDTETTGLSTGTGTYVFLVGLAHLTAGGEVEVEQYLMPDPSGEQAFLIAVAERLDTFDHLASFNGKSFDLPLLSHRYTMNRMRAQLEFTGHCDLLHPARNLWRRVLPSCSLASLESHRLEVNRIDDIPGSEVPARYFLFLSDGNFDHLAPVVRHNTLDLISSVALTAHMLQVAEGPGGTEEALALGRMARRAGDHDRANAYFSDVLEESESLSALAVAAEELSRWLKREDRWDEAVDLWSWMIERIEASELGLTAGPFPYIEMAKYCEHRSRDLDSALQYTRRAISSVRRQSQIGPRSRRQMSELQHRLRRVQRKITTRSRT
ncbi:MAG: ribonuclease H-like domain-containing protein [Bacillota bacterium]